jgi:hypothetical protein
MNVTTRERRSDIAGSLWGSVATCGTFVPLLQTSMLRATIAGTMNRRFWWFTAGVAALCVAIVIYYVYSMERSKPAQPAAAQPPAPAADEAAPILHPVPAAPSGSASAALPPLNASDPVITDALSELFGKPAIAEFLVRENVIHHIVATLDNLPRKAAPAQGRPVIPTAGRFITSGPEDAPVVSPDNYKRYAPLVQLLAAADTERLASFYIRFYPLFQSSYESLGNSSVYFNDRLVEVIDHLLTTPDVKGPIKLTQPSVYYQFADPALEGLSAGQKVLIRMGSENAAVVKRKLREFRQKIANIAR